MAGEECAAAAVGPDDGSGRNSSEEETAVTVGAAVAVVGVVTALQTEWLAKRVRMSFRRRRLKNGEGRRIIMK